MYDKDDLTQHLGMPSHLRVSLRVLPGNADDVVARDASFLDFLTGTACTFANARRYGRDGYVALTA